MTLFCALHHDFGTLTAEIIIIGRSMQEEEKKSNLPHRLLRFLQSSHFEGRAHTERPFPQDSRVSHPRRTLSALWAYTSTEATPPRDSPQTQPGRLSATPVQTPNTVCTLVQRFKTRIDPGLRSNHIKYFETVIEFLVRTTILSHVID